MAEPDLATALANLVTEVGTNFKLDRTKMGDLTSLSTTAKSSLVAALNELAASIGGAGATINDASASTTAVYSSQHVTDLIAAAKSQILDGAPAALDTLAELSAALSNDPNAITALTTAVGNRVRFDAAQSLTTPQKAQVQSNLDVYSKAAIGDPTTDLVAVLNAALA